MTPQEQLRLFREGQKKETSIQGLSPQEQLAQFRASRSVGSSLGMERAKSFDELTTETGDENFDYETGASGGLRALVSFGETPGDKEAILKKLVGEEGYTKDSEGRLALTPEGQKIRGMEPSDKNIVLEEKGFSFRDLADLTGIVPETVGSVIGGILGAPGFVTGAAGAAAGAVAGQAVEEAIEAMLGVQTQTAPEVTKDLAKEALLAGSFDAAGTAIFVVGKKIIGAGGKIIQKGTGAFGEAPIDDVAKAQRGLNIMQRGRTTTDPVTGEQITTTGFVSPRAAGLGAGVARPFEISGVISGFNFKKAIQNVRYALSGRDELLQKYGSSNVDELAENIKDFAPAKRKLIEDEIEKQQKLHLNAIDDTITALTKASDGNVALDDEIVQNLIKNYNEFIKTSKKEFGKLDTILGKNLGSARLFDYTSILRKHNDILEQEFAGNAALAGRKFEEIDELMKSLGKATDPTTGREIAVDFISFNGLKGLRKNVNDTIRTLSITDTTPRRKLTRLLKDIDETLDKGLSDEAIQLARGSGNRIVTESLAGIGPAKIKKLSPAAKQLKKAREHYAKEIKLFDALEKSHLVRNFHAAGSDVTLAVGDIVGENASALLKNVKNMKAVFAVTDKYGTTDAVKKSLQRKFLDESMEASGKDALNPSAFNGVMFNKQVTNFGNAKGKFLFGDDWSKIKALGRSLALGSKTLDDRTLQKIVKNAEEVTPDQSMVTTLKSIRDAKINLDKATSFKALKEATSGGDPVEAAKLLTNKNITPSQADQVLDFFSGNPAAIQTIKRTMINDILSSVDEGIFVNASSSASLKKALDSYDQKVLEKLIGKEELASIRELSEELLLLSDTSAKGAGSLAADAIRTGVFTNPLKNLPKVARFKAISAILNNPKTMIKLLEVKAGQKTPQEAAEGVVRTLNESVSESAGRQVDVAEELTGGARRAGRTLDAINRGRIFTRQAGARALITPQEARGVPPEQPKRTTLDLPTVPRTMDLSNLTITGPQTRTKPSQQSIRQRAAQNPYLAASLLGGLGSAGLLKN